MRTVGQAWATSARSTAIAVGLRCRGIGVTCLAYGAEAPIERDGVSWLPLDSSATRDAQVLVVDSYRLRTDQITALAGSMPLVLLHDFGEPPPEAALVVSPAGEDAGPDGHRLTGFGCVALRPMFWGLPQRKLRQKVGRILVTTGGGNLESVGHDLAGRLADALPEARVALVRGPHGRLDPPDGWTHRFPDSLLVPLLQADIAVTAGGQTMLEAAAIGTPCVAVPLVENQTRQASLLAQIGAVRLMVPGKSDVTSSAESAVASWQTIRQRARR